MQNTNNKVDDQECEEMTSVVKDMAAEGELKVSAPASSMEPNKAIVA